MNPLITEIKQLLARYETTEPDDIAEIGTLEVGTEFEYIKGQADPEFVGKRSRILRFRSDGFADVESCVPEVPADCSPNFKVRVISRPKPAPKPTALEQLPEGVRDDLDNMENLFSDPVYRDGAKETLAQTILDNKAAIFAAGEPVIRRLPQTKDGVLVAPGDFVWLQLVGDEMPMRYVVSSEAWCGADNGGDSIKWLAIPVCHEDVNAGVSFVGGSNVSIGECYSTRALALQANKGAEQ